METVRTSSPQQHGTPAAQGARATRGSGKAAGADTAGAQSPQDAFAALLAALGGDDGLLAQDAGLPLADDESAGAGGTGLAQDPAGLLGQGQQQPWNAAAAAQAAALAAGGNGGAAPGGVAQGGAPLQGAAAAWNAVAALGAQAPDSLVAQTASIDKAADLTQAVDNPPGQAGSVPGKGTAARWMGWNTAMAASGTAAAQAAPAHGTVAQDKKAGADLLAPLAPAGTAAVALPGTERRDMHPGAGMERMAAMQGDSAAAALAAGLQDAAPASSEGRQGAREGGAGEGGAQPAHASAGGAEQVFEPGALAPDGSSVAADATQQAVDEQMAEQVAFWVDQNNQSAEMTLDRDGEPVQVRVSVSGNEAHVVFRSDQVQTRDALDASMAQLRELLQSQGLVLAGATVDSSASGSGQREPGQRQGGQQGRAQVAVPGVEGGVGGTRAAVPQQGRPGLDVFV